MNKVRFIVLMIGLSVFFGCQARSSVADKEMIGSIRLMVNGLISMMQVVARHPEAGNNLAAFTGPLDEKERFAFLAGVDDFIQGFNYALPSPIFGKDPVTVQNNINEARTARRAVEAHEETVEALNARWAREQ